MRCLDVGNDQMADNYNGMKIAYKMVLKDMKNIELVVNEEFLKALQQVFSDKALSKDQQDRVSQILSDLQENLYKRLKL